MTLHFRATRHSLPKSNKLLTMIEVNAVSKRISGPFCAFPHNYMILLLRNWTATLTPPPDMPLSQILTVINNGHQTLFIGSARL